MQGLVGCKEDWALPPLGWEVLTAEMGRDEIAM